MDWRILKQRLIIIIAGLILFYLTYWGHSITSKRVTAMKEGQIIKAEISRVSSRRTLRSFFVSIKGVEYDAGQAIPGRKDAEINAGDTISVFWRKELEYVAPVGKSYRNSIILQSIVIYGIAPLLILLGIFYPREKILRSLEKANKGLRR
jgi:hypothetical protein